MLRDLVEAARLARVESVDPRTIEILLTEIGLVVRGKSVARGQEISATQDLDWSDFDRSPWLISNSVRLVADRLRAAEESGR